MIIFKTWVISSTDGFLAQQYDNKSRYIKVSGKIPNIWDWVAIVKIGEYMDFIPLFEQDGYLVAELTADQLSISGEYTLQIRATAEDIVRHTNTIKVNVPASLSGDANWPEIPTEFTDLERRVNESANRAEDAQARAEEAAKRAEEAGGGGGANGKDGGYYTPSVSQPTADTMRVSYAASKDDMPVVPPVSVTLTAGPAGTNGKDGYTPQKGVDYYTDDDKQEMVNAVLAALPNGDEVSY
jgi:hypothetical protein